MRGLGHLRDAGVGWNALTTIHDANADRGAEVYRFLRDERGARFVQFIPIVERVAETTDEGMVPWTSWRDRPLYTQEGDRVTGRSVTAEQYGRFLIDVFEEWVRRDVGEVFVQMFDVALANWYGEPPRPPRALGDVRARARAHGRRLFLRPLRRAATQARGHHHIDPAMRYMCERLRREEAPYEIVAVLDDVGFRRAQRGRKDPAEPVTDDYRGEPRCTRSPAARSGGRRRRLRRPLRRFRARGARDHEARVAAQT